MDQIIAPAYSMNTEYKFKFINGLLNKQPNKNSTLELIFNRFEQRKLMDKIESNKHDSSNKFTERPLLAQLTEQVDIDSIPLMKVQGKPPFSVDLVGEGSIDGGCPSHEIFSSLIFEMMNDHLGIFTPNPNYRHDVKESNKEDLIPNINDKISEEFVSSISILLSSNRFIFDGALIGCCIVSSIPQSMKLSNIVWDFLTRGFLSIESIYEIDHTFEELIKNAENTEKKIKFNQEMNDDEFIDHFMHSFDIKNSFDEIVELVPSGSTIKVNKNNLHEFIQLSKNFRLHEFDSILNLIKKGFDTIMTYSNITKILHPSELKLLCCGEPTCSVKQMKKLTRISVCDLENENLTEDDLIRMFWNVMENSLSANEEMHLKKFLFCLEKIKK